jgi:hypothetical protein
MVHGRFHAQVHAPSWGILDWDRIDPAGLGTMNQEYVGILGVTADEGAPRVRPDTSRRESDDTLHQPPGLALSAKEPALNINH